MAPKPAAAAEAPSPATEDAEHLEDDIAQQHLDFLISLRDLVAARARGMGCPQFIDKVDHRMLRTIGFVLLHVFREELTRNYP
ncbi:hypothetical protein EJB05_19100 [Eragrostis curvula]|uniref:Uncharacterized protein n=1 Tax=Eragrostis curvula TaxID=38414 RepID=A0A5J9UVJ0_9POAL|nr:hypothetical protein EJB05_19100 [Eragrostis curvula]